MRVVVNVNGVNILVGVKKSYGFDTSSPAKKGNHGMSYDIKEASNQSLSKSARKHYAENAQAANKSGYKG